MDLQFNQMMNQAPRNNRQNFGNQQGFNRQ